MNYSEFTPIMRMVERSIIVLGGILAIYLGYRLFVLGIDKTQGSASAFNLVELKNFGPGLFFAALGAIVLVTSMKAAIKVQPETISQEQNVLESESEKTGSTGTSSSLFLGMEDLDRVSNEWSSTAFFLETRELIDHLEQDRKPEEEKFLINGLKKKLNSITMSTEEYKRFQELSEKVPLNKQEQKELILLERKLYPKQK